MITMKYASNTKVERNQALREYAQSHPDLSQREIGKAFGITRQRANQIIKQRNNEKTSTVEAQ